MAIPSWLTLSKTSGTGNDTVNITAAENTGTDARNASLTIRRGAKSKTLAISQRGVETYTDVQNIYGDTADDFYIYLPLTTTVDDEIHISGVLQKAVNGIVGGKQGTQSNYYYRFDISQKGFVWFYINQENIASYIGASVGTHYSFKLGNYYIYNEETHSNIVSGDTKLSAPSLPYITNPTGFKIDRLYIVRNGVTVFDGYPKMRDSDGQGGLWDTVTNDFYTNEDYTIYHTEKTVLEISPDEMTFGTQGGTSQLNITTNKAWTITSVPSWVTLSKVSGTGNDNVTVTLGENIGADVTAAISITAGTEEGFMLTKTLSVSQSGSMAYTEVQNIYGDTADDYYITLPITTTKDDIITINGIWQKGTYDIIVGGINASSDSNDFRFFITEDGAIYLDIGSRRTNRLNWATIGQHYSLRIQNLSIYDIATQTTIVSATAASSAPSLTYVFEPTTFKLESLKVERNGVTVFDGYAVSRDSDGQGGIFDNVTNDFYTNEDHTVYCTE